jgi:hypothetical protein
MFSYSEIGKKLYSWKDSCMDICSNNVSECGSNTQNIINHAKDVVNDILNGYNNVSLNKLAYRDILDGNNIVKTANVDISYDTLHNLDASLNQAKQLKIRGEQLIQQGKQIKDSISKTNEGFMNISDNNSLLDIGNIILVLFILFILFILTINKSLLSSANNIINFKNLKKFFI